jgi:hypothetical protein
VTVVLEHLVAAAHGGHIQVRVAVIVDVGKGGRHAHPVSDRDPCRCRYVFKFSAAEVSPQLIAADLTDEINVREPVAVDIGNSEAVAMIVVSRLVRLAGVVDNAVLERDAAPGQSIGELEVVKHRRRGSGLDLRLAKRLEPGDVLQVRRHHTNGHARPAAWRERLGDRRRGPCVNMRLSLGLAEQHRRQRRHR